MALNLLVHGWIGIVSRHLRLRILMDFWLYFGRRRLVRLIVRALS